MKFPEVRYTYDHQRPGVGADTAVFWFDTGLQKLYLAVIRRGQNPYKGLIALPGGHVDPGKDGYGEKVVDAAIREVREEIGIDLFRGRMKFVKFYDEPKRDPRGWRISFLYYHLCDTLIPHPQLVFGDDASEAYWYNLTDFDINHADWSFDHADIVYDAWKKLHLDHSFIPQPKNI